MIQFNDWRIAGFGPLLARQFDHLTRELRVVGELPDGWSWDVLVQAGKRLDIIHLSPAEGGLSVTLTAEMLALAGYYAIQLRGVQGELVRHTNVIQVYVGPSLSGDAQWPELPSEFSQAEERIRELNQHPPVPGENGYWMLWDPEGDAYVPSELPLPAGGGGGYRIGAGLKLDPESNTLSVDTAAEVEKDNTKPVTSGAVYLQLGNVEALLKTI